MKNQRYVLAMLVLGMLLSPFGSSVGRAQIIGFGGFARPYFGYGYGGYGGYGYPNAGYYGFGGSLYGFGGGVGVTPFGYPSTWGTMPYGYSYYTPPQVYSYVMPSPAYGILPPPFMTARSGSSGDYFSAGKTAEDYGYTRDYFEGTPRKRGTLYPAIPNDAVAKEDRQADARRVRFNITVPNGDSTVLMDGAKTRQAGIEREYVTPPLELDRLYSSTIDVYWFDDTGKKYERKKTFEFIAGETVRHTFRE